MSREEELPELRSIRTPRHPGVSSALCESFSEAAEVCFARHHNPPRILLRVTCAGKESARSLKWSTPDETAKLSWGNRDDTTRDGAYIVSLAVVEHELGMVALHLDKNWLTLKLEDGTYATFDTVPEMLDDVVGPMVNKHILVTGSLKKKRKNVCLLVSEVEVVDEE